MGKLKMGLLGLAAALLLAACAGTPNTPTGVAQGFLDKMTSLDFDGAASLATEEGATILKGMKGMMSMMPKDQLAKEAKKGKVTDVKETGDTAVATYTEEGSSTPKTITLKKVSGNWKVDFKKDLGM